MGWGGGVVVAYEILVSAQGPLVLGFGALGLTVLGQGLTIYLRCVNEAAINTKWKKICIKYLIETYSFLNETRSIQELFCMVESIYMDIHEAHDERGDQCASQQGAFFNDKISSSYIVKGS